MRGMLAPLVARRALVKLAEPQLLCDIGVGFNQSPSREAGGVRSAAGAADLRGSVMRLAHRAICAGVLLFAGLGAPAALGAGRVLTASDVVAIRIVGHPELDWTARGGSDGTINFPYVGRVRAAGRAEDDLARAVWRRLVELKVAAAP